MEITNKTRKYKNASHLTFSCPYHVIFCPKYRRKVLTGDVEPRLKEIFRDVAQKYEFDIVEMEIMPDHVHLVVDCNPRFGILNCITKLKGTTSNILRGEFPELKSKIPSLWTRSAFISTVGTVSLETFKQYIENQKGQ